MPFSASFQWLPGDDAGLNRFLLDHYVSHRRYIGALAELATPFKAVDLPIQRLEKWPDWLAAHQQMSQSVWTGLGGGQGTDFGSLKYDDPAAMQDWMLYHYNWHKVVDEALGL